MPRREITTVAVVTALSPSGTTLAEYGFHLLAALGRRPGLRVVALVEDLEADYPEIEGVEIRRTWRFNTLTTPLRVARAARDVGADVVLLNAHFTSFGAAKLAATAGLATPALLRIVGIPAITLLHNLVESVDLAAAGFGSSRLVHRALRWAGAAVTRLVLWSNLVVTTMPAYVEILRRRYGATNVALTPHGTFEVPAEPADPPAAPVILAFGKFGTYKRVDQLIAAVRRLGRDDVTLVIAGTDSPNARGYLADVEARLGGADVQFTGYVDEADVERTFREATVAVFPYDATTGSSGVLHQAASFGCAPVVARVGDLDDVVREEGFTAGFFTPGDVEEMSREIARLLDDDRTRAEIARRNYAAACGLTMDMVVDLHLAHIGEVVDGDIRSALRADLRADRAPVASS